MKNSSKVLVLTLLMGGASGILAAPIIPAAPAVPAAPMMKQADFPVDLVLQKVNEYIDDVKAGKSIDEMIQKTKLWISEYMQYLPAVLLGIGNLDTRIQAVPAVTFGAAGLRPSINAALDKVFTQPFQKEGVITAEDLKALTPEVVSFVKTNVVPHAQKALALLDGMLMDLAVTLGVIRLSMDMFPMLVEQEPSVPQEVKNFVNSAQFARLASYASILFDVLGKDEMAALRDVATRELRNVLFNGDYSVAKLVDVLSRGNVAEIQNYLPRYYAMLNGRIPLVIDAVKPYLPAFVQALKNAWEQRPVPAMPMVTTTA